MRAMRVAAFAFTVAAGAASFASAQPASVPWTTVTSQLGLMNELQKRGPYAQSYGPDAGGRYLIVGPIAPSRFDRRDIRARPHRRHHRIR